MLAKEASLAAPDCDDCLQLGGHHRLEDYMRRGEEPGDEIQMYTWHDASLRELTELVQQVQPSALRSNARLEFAFVYPDRKGHNVIRQVDYLSS